MISDFLSEDEARTIISGSDLVVLPYDETPESASGAAALRDRHWHRGADDGGHLPRTARAVEQVSSNDPGALASAIERLLGDDELRRDVAALRAYARDVSWTNVAQRHAEIYRGRAARRHRQLRRRSQLLRESRCQLLEDCPTDPGVKHPHMAR